MISWAAGRGAAIGVAFSTRSKQHPNYQHTLGDRALLCCALHRHDIHVIVQPAFAVAYSQVPGTQL